jgi:hypothetical protein
MEIQDMPPALQERLGPEASIALVDLFDKAKQEWTVGVTTAAVERLERRLLEFESRIREDLGGKIAQVRDDLGAQIAHVREDLISREGRLRADMLSSHAELREDMHAGDASLRLEMTRGFASIREDMALLKFDLLKWSFAFSIGQVVVLTTIAGLMLRALQT